MKKICFINPPYGKFAEELDAPFNLMYLAAVAEKAGWEASIIDMRSMDDSLPEADIYGVTSTSPQWPDALVLSDRLAVEFPRKLRLIGGPHISACQEDLMWSNFNVAVLGEGEIVLENGLRCGFRRCTCYLHGVKRRRRPRNQSRTASISPYNARTHALPICTCYLHGVKPHDLDSIPFPARHLVDWSRYKRGIYWGKEKLADAVSIISSRGCPFNCLHGDTLVDTIDGFLRIKDLIGKTPKVLTRNPTTLAPEYAQVSEVRKTRKNAELVRVHFDSGAFIDCTPDHLFMTFKGGNQHAETAENQIQAKDLNIGQSLRAIHYEKTAYGYVDVLWGRRKRVGKHRLILEAALGRKLAEKECAHHIDGNKKNNIESNIVLTSSDDHIGKFHPEVSQRMKERNPVKNLPKEYFSKLGKMNIGKVRTLEARLKYRASKLGKKNPKYKHGERSEASGRKESRIKEVNHKVVKIEKLGHKADTYCMEVPGYNWFYANQVLVHNCVFCGSHVVFGRGVRFRSVGNVVAEIKHVIDTMGYRGFNFHDDTFCINRSRVFSLCEEFSKLGILWRCLSRVDTVDEKILNAMWDAGCKEIILGVESGSQKILDRLNKGVTVEQNLKAMQLIKKSGIQLKVGIIVGSPGETWETAKETEELLKKCPPDFWNVSCFTPFPGSYSWAYPEKLGLKILTRDLREYAMVGRNWKGNVVVETEKMKKSDIEQARDRLIDLLMELSPPL